MTSHAPVLLGLSQSLFENCSFASGRWYAPFGSPKAQVVDQGVETCRSHIRILIKVPLTAESPAGISPFEGPALKIVGNWVCTVRCNIGILRQIPLNVKKTGLRN